MRMGSKVRMSEYDTLIKQKDVIYLGLFIRVERFITKRVILQIYKAHLLFGADLLTLFSFSTRVVCVY